MALSFPGQGLASGVWREVQLLLRRFGELLWKSGELQGALEVTDLEIQAFGGRKFSCYCPFT